MLYQLSHVRAPTARRDRPAGAAGRRAFRTVADPARPQTQLQPGRRPPPTAISALGSGRCHPRAASRACQLARWQAVSHANCDRHRRRASPSRTSWTWPAARPRAELGPDVAGPDGAQPGRRGRRDRRRTRRSTASTPASARSPTPASASRTWTALQGAIIRSHAAGAGRAAGRRAPSARCCCCGPGRWPPATPGVRPDLPRRLLELLDLRPAPGRPRQGLGRRLRRPGPARPPGPAADRRGPAARPRRRRRTGRPAAEVLAEHGLEPLELAPKEGLSLVNGTEPMQALLAFSRRTTPDCWSRPPTSPARCRSRRCSAPTGPTTSGSR